MKDDFVIDQVGWHTNTPGNPEPISEAHARFRAIIEFLQNNHLTVKAILHEKDRINDSTQIRKADLTDEGFAFMKNAYDKWLRFIDRGNPPTDTQILEKELSKIRR